jgi:hypothetical protein
MNRIFTLALALVLATGLVRSAAAEIADSDRAGIQSIIGSQIEAFRSDDGAAAYDFASPMIQTLYPTPDLFMQMVQTGYMPVYRPQAFTFGPLVESPRGPVQRVFITGPDGAGYVAEYTLQRQPDGTWKINGVTLVKDTSPTI